MQRAAWAAPSEVAATLRALSAKMEAAEAEVYDLKHDLERLKESETEYVNRADAAEASVARLKALLEANDAWAVGEPSKPPRATLQEDKE